MLHVYTVLAIVAATLLIPHNGASAADPETAPSPAAKPIRVYSVEASRPLVIAEEGLRIELVDVKDERCPIEVRCISAGHAAVTLRVAQGDAPPTTIVIGSEPSEVDLPSEADVGAYRVGLRRLDPRYSAASKPALPDYKASVQVTRR